MNYKRILIKLSGQMLGEKGGGFSVDAARRTAKEIKTIAEQCLEIAVLVGGGNIMRARDAEGLDRLTADFMGMTATIINALGLKNALEKEGIDARVLSAVNLEGITERLVVDRAIDYLSDKKVVIFAGGTGSPYVTTDTAAALRALEINADIILKATRVEGVYTSDPEIDADAKFYDKISFKDALEKGLKIMDKAALSLLEENNLGVIVFNFLESGNLKRLVNGESIGTIVT